MKKLILALALAAVSFTAAATPGSIVPTDVLIEPPVEYTMIIEFQPNSQYQMLEWFEALPMFKVVIDGLNHLVITEMMDGRPLNRASAFYLHSLFDSLDTRVVRLRLIKLELDSTVKFDR